MKRSCILISLVLYFSVSSFAQTNLFPPNGNVGIGTATPSVSYKLDIVGGLSAVGSESRFSNGIYGDPVPGASYAVKIGGGGMAVNGQSYFSGNIGIGSTSPGEKLDVTGNIYLRNMSNIIGGGSSILFSSYSNNHPGPRIRSYLDFASGEQSRSRLVLSSYNNGYKDELTLMDGNVSIGASDSKGYKLAVAGNMIAESVKVKLQGTWPDYVFTKDYRLPSLIEIEKYIKEKGHLPGIPSAGEVKTNGIDLGEMNAKLLEKIEELTLHLIKKEAELNNQKQLLSQQQLQLTNQQVQIDDILNKLKK